MLFQLLNSICSFSQSIDENKLFKKPCPYCRTNSFRNYFDKMSVLKDFSRDTSFWSIYFYIIQFRNNKIDSIYEYNQLDTLTSVKSALKYSSDLWNYDYVNNKVMVLEISALILGSEYYYDKSKHLPPLKECREKYVNEILQKHPNCSFIAPFELKHEITCILTYSVDTTYIPINAKSK